MVISMFCENIYFLEYVNAIFFFCRGTSYWKLILLLHWWPKVNEPHDLLIFKRTQWYRQDREKMPSEKLFSMSWKRISRAAYKCWLNSDSFVYIQRRRMNDKFYFHDVYRTTKYSNTSKYIFYRILFCILKLTLNGIALVVFSTHRCHYSFLQTVSFHL